MNRHIQARFHATAIYGHGASGGVINIITKKPVKGDPQYWTEVGGSSSLTQVEKDSIGGWVRQGATGGAGSFDYAVSVSAQHIPDLFDAEGRVIPPEPAQSSLSDSNVYDLFGKIGWEDTVQRLELTANIFRARQDTDLVSDPAVNTVSEPVTARAISGLKLDEQPESDNDVFNLSYRHNDVLGSQFNSQLYYRDYLTRFFPFSGRLVRNQPSVVQSYLDSRTWGGRLALDTPLFQADQSSLSVLWGADFANEKTKQPVTIYDLDVYNSSGGLRYEKIGGTGWVPPIEHGQLAAFAQLEWVLNDQWTLRGGLRHERIEVSVEDYETLGEGANIEGGSVDYNDTVYNLGTAFAATDSLNLYANYSEGFSLPDVGLILRGAPADFSVSRTNLEPLKVKNYELGMRNQWSQVETSLSVFFSKSELGFFSRGLNDPINRAPERVQGVEATLDFYPTDQLALGGSISWIKGEYKEAKTAEYEALNGWRIPPLKLTTYVEYEMDSGWRNRLQVLYSGNRDDAAEYDPGVFGRASVEHYTVVDLLTSKSIGSRELSAGIENLLNNDYYNVFSQLRYSGNVSHFKAPGRTLRVSYTYHY